MSSGHGGAGCPGGEAPGRLTLHHRFRVGGQLRGRDSGQVGAVCRGQRALGVAVVSQLGQHFRIPGWAAAQHEVSLVCVVADMRCPNCARVDKRSDCLAGRRVKGLSVLQSRVR